MAWGKGELGTQSSYKSVLGQFVAFCSVRVYMHARETIEGADRTVCEVWCAVRRQPGAHTIHAHNKVAKTWPVCIVCNGWVMLSVCMGKTRFGGIIWGEVVLMHCHLCVSSCVFLHMGMFLETLST